jgi:hypothetical protein
MKIFLQCTQKSNQKKAGKTPAIFKYMLYFIHV